MRPCNITGYVLYSAPWRCVEAIVSLSERMSARQPRRIFSNLTYITLRSRNTRDTPRSAICLQGQACQGWTASVRRGSIFHGAKSPEGLRGTNLFWGTDHCTVEHLRIAVQEQHERYRPSRRQGSHPWKACFVGLPTDSIVARPSAPLYTRLKCKHKYS